jgi:hypothetical protein
MSPPDAVAKPSQEGQIPLFLQGRSPDVLSLKCGLPQKLYSFCLSQELLASVVHTLPCVVYDGSQRCYGNTLPGGMDTSPLAGKVPGCLEPKQGLPQKLFEFSLFQKLLASAVHTLTCSDQSWRNPGFFFFYRTSMYPSLLHHISSTYHVFMKYNFK